VALILDVIAVHIAGDVEKMDGKIRLFLNINKKEN
jgi:hypothetical protein